MSSLSVVDLARLVKRCRDKQREYFSPALRRPSSLADSRALEKQLDEAVEEILNAQPSLFGE